MSIEIIDNYRVRNLKNGVEYAKNYYIGLTCIWEYNFNLKITKGECPVCYETDVFGITCENKHMAMCESCVSKKYENFDFHQDPQFYHIDKCPICRNKVVYCNITDHETFEQNNYDEIHHDDFDIRILDTSKILANLCHFSFDDITTQNYKFFEVLDYCEEIEHPHTNIDEFFEL